MRVALYACEEQSFLGEFYKDQPGSALRAQMYFLIERQKAFARSARRRFAAALLLRFPDGKKIASSFAKT